MQKIDFHITEIVNDKIKKALLEYGDFEIGGILIGQKLSENNFQIIDVSISSQNRKYAKASFSRDPKSAKELLENHFESKTGYYIGEWHSHPNYPLIPSKQDVRTMLKILHDESYGVSFAVLLIVQLVQGEVNQKGFFFHKDIQEVIPLE